LVGCCFSDWPPNPTRQPHPKALTRLRTELDIER
jgi:hypothetical protein